MTLDGLSLIGARRYGIPDGANEALQENKSE
jgi:hypothetical protein